MLRIWEKLTPLKKAELEKKRNRADFRAEITLEARTLNLTQKPFPRDEEKIYDARIEGDAEFKQFLYPLYPALRQLENSAKKSDEAQKKADSAVKKRVERPFAEFLYFEDHKPKPVSQRNIERFLTSCPAWFQAMLDPLSADDARAYLTIVYRLLYPESTEMPAEAKPAKAATPPGPTPSSAGQAPKKSKPAAPF